MSEPKVRALLTGFKRNQWASPKVTNCKGLQACDLLHEARPLTRPPRPCPFEVVCQRLLRLCVGCSSVHNPQPANHPSAISLPCLHRSRAAGGTPRWFCWMVLSSPLARTHAGSWGCRPRGAWAGWIHTSIQAWKFAEEQLHLMPSTIRPRSQMTTTESRLVTSSDRPASAPSIKAVLHR